MIRQHGARIRLSVEGGIARLELVNPENRNAVDLQFCREFAAAGLECERDAGIRVILLSAEGEVFSVGGDLRVFIEERNRAEAYVREMAQQFHVGILALSRAAAPVVLALNGMAAGGGFSIVCGADLVIARSSARLNPAYARTGLTPDGGGTWLLPRIVGLRRAFDLLATSPTLSAAQALDLGLVSRVVEDAVFESEVERLVQSLAQLPEGGLPALKRLLRSSAVNSLEAQLEEEAASISARAAADSTQEQLLAFFQRSR